MKTELTVDWLMGMIDGDGYFGLERISLKRKNHNQTFYRPILAISQKDPSVLYKIKTFVGCGSVSSKGKKKDQYHFRVRTTHLFLTYLVPLFENKRFQTVKQNQWLILKKACDLLETGFTLEQVPTLEQMGQILRRQRYNHLYTNSEILNKDWFLGFFEAEGCFSLSIVDFQDVRFTFKVTQKNKPILLKIQRFFGYGTIQTETPGIYCFQVTGFKTIMKSLFPFLEKSHFHGQKNIRRVQWLKACRLVNMVKQEGDSEKRNQKLLKLKSKLNQSQDS